MNCDEVYELLPVYVGGGLGREERGRIAAHLAVCGECRHEAALSIRLGLAQHKLNPPLPDKVRESAFRLIEEEKRSGQEPCALHTLRQAMGVTRSALKLTYELVKI